MTLIWDTGKNIGAVGQALGIGNSRIICWCEANGTYAAVYVRETGGNTLFCYAYGDDNAWTEEVLVRSNAATGRLGIQATVESFSLDVHQTGGANDHVHIAWCTGGLIYHSELVVPDVPNNNGNWTAWGGTRYQRVDNNAGGLGYYGPSISVDTAGNPHIAYGHSDASETICYNYGNGANHAFTPANELSLGTTSNAVEAEMIAVPEAGRDLYVFWDNGNSVNYRYCPNASNPLVIGNWAVAVSPLTFANSVSSFSASYWYDLGGALCQLFVAGTDGTATKSNWYDEGNVNGWGGGWRGQVTEVPVTSWVQVTQVDANDFALVYWSTVGKFAFTDYGNNQYDCITSTYYEFTNKNIDECVTEFRGRENDNYSFGVLHIQQTSDIMFDLVRVNARPTAVSLDPDAGQREDEGNIITCSWTFTDPGQSQTKRRIQVQAFGGDWSVIVYDSNAQVGALESWNIPALTLTFNTHYEWRVKVWDDEEGDEYDPYSDSDWEE